MKIGFLGCVASLLLVDASPLVAQPVDPLEAAVELWLEGDDATCLPRLAALAASEHREARLLLARIETEDLGLSAFRQDLTAGEARDLFRQPSEGFFPKSWIAVEAEEGNALALALQAANRPEPSFETIYRLYELGEHQAADHPTRILALYGDEESKRTLSNSPAMLPELAPYVAYLSGPEEARGDGLAAMRHILPEKAEDITPSSDDALGMAGYLALGLGFGDHRAENVWRGPVEDWLLTAPSMRPIANLCHRSCAEEAGPCAFAFLGLSGGYYEAIRFDSPLESVIPQERFLTSLRAEQMVLRRAALARTETNLKRMSELPELREISQCAANLVTEAQKSGR